MVNKSIDYIIRHLDEEISIEDVADYCYLSKYHFSRIFKAETGVSLYAFIKRLKMEQSALRPSLKRINLLQILELILDTVHQIIVQHLRNITIFLLQNFEKA